MDEKISFFLGIGGDIILKENKKRYHSWYIIFFKKDTISQKKVSNRLFTLRCWKKKPNKGHWNAFIKGTFVPYKELAIEHENTFCLFAKRNKYYNKKFEIKQQVIMMCL